MYRKRRAREMVQPLKAGLTTKNIRIPKYSDECLQVKKYKMIWFSIFFLIFYFKGEDLQLRDMELNLHPCWFPTLKSSCFCFLSSGTTRMSCYASLLSIFFLEEQEQLEEIFLNVNCHTTFIMNEKQDAWMTF